MIPTGGVSPLQIVYYLAYLLLIVIAALGEYLHLLPNGTLLVTFVAVSGHFLGATPTMAALSENTAATRLNTIATTVSTASTAPLAPGGAQEVVAPPVSPNDPGMQG